MAWFTSAGVYVRVSWTWPFALNNETTSVLLGTVVSAVGMVTHERQTIRANAGCMFTPVNSRAPVASKTVVLTAMEPFGPAATSSTHWLLTVRSKATWLSARVPCCMVIGSGKTGFGLKGGGFGSTIALSICAQLA